MALSMKTLDGGQTTIDSAVLEAFSDSLRGDVLTSSSADYDEARAIWNAMIDRCPGIIVRCAGPADVVRAVRFARDHGLLLAVRGAGHNIAGNAVCDDGLVFGPGHIAQAHAPDEYIEVDQLFLGARILHHFLESTAAETTP